LNRAVFGKRKIALESLRVDRKSKENYQKKTI